MNEIEEIKQIIYKFTTLGAWIKMDG